MPSDTRPKGSRTAKVFGGDEPRACVETFARALERRLRQNDHKTGLDDMRVDTAIDRAWDEIRELELEAHRDRFNPVSTWKCMPHTLERTASEALDLAAYALAVWFGAKRDFEERSKEIYEEVQTILEAGSSSRA